MFFFERRRRKRSRRTTTTKTFVADGVFFFLVGVVFFATKKLLRFNRGASAILVPHPDKSATGGEDSCFVLKRSNAFGVFDGVGGWSDEGVNPAEYSETFASEAAKAVTKDKMRNPVDIMVRAHKMTRVVGSSTACVCVVEEGEATFANVGDAGGIVARNGACVFKTEPMQHEFNMPFQLG